MQHQNPLNKVPGSFVKPPEPQRRPPQPKPEPQQVAPQHPQQPPAQAAAENLEITNDVGPSKAEEEKREVAIAKIKEQLEKSLDAKITEADLEKYIFQGSFSKDVLIIKTEKLTLRGTFRTHTPSDSLQVDEDYAKVIANKKHTEEGLQNEKGLLTLSTVWTHANGKPIGKDAADRLSRMRNMGAFIVENASRANSDFQLLLKIALEEGGLLKK